jgi:hypothetical protein
MAATVLDKFTRQGLDAPVERSQITEDEQRKYDDEAALQILKQDTEKFESDKIYKDFTQLWTVCHQLLNSPWLNNYFFNPAKANVPRYTLSNIIDVVTTKAHSALFFEETPFMLLPNPKLDQKVMWAKEAVLETQLREMGFDVECDKGWFQCAHLGTQIYKYGWLDDTKKASVFKAKEAPQKFQTPLGEKQVDTPQSDDFEWVEEPKDLHRPWLKWRDLRYLLYSPDWNVGDIRHCPVVIDTDYPTLDELDDLRGLPGYDIPSKAELESLFFPPENTGESAIPGDVTETRPAQMRAWITHSEGREVNTSADPYQRKIRLLERVDNKGNLTVALENRHGFLLIKNGKHDYTDFDGKPCVNYLSSTWRPLPSSGFGMGLGQLVGPDQQVEKGTLCAYLDILAFIARPSYVREKPLNAVTQDIVVDLGKIISIETGGKPVRDVLSLLEQPKIDQSLVYAIEAAKSSAANTSGATEITGQGGTVGAGRGTGMRSGSGAQLVGQAQAGRLDGPMERFIRQVFVPWLYIMDGMNSKRLPARTLREILSNDDAHDYSKFDHIAWRNAQVNYQVLAGSHLGPRKQMAEFMPFIQQMVSNPPLMQALSEADYSFDAPEFVKTWAQLAGFKYVTPFFKPMTAEQKQKRDANSQAALQQKQANSDAAIQQMKGDQKENQISSEAQGRAAEKVTQLLLQNTMAPSVDEKEPEIGG